MYTCENNVNLKVKKRSTSSFKQFTFNEEKRHVVLRKKHTNFFKKEIIRMMATIIAIRNGVEDGGDLFMTISEGIYNENLKSGAIDKKSDIKIIIDSANRSYKEQVRPNGAWVYSMDETTGWIFERYDTIEEAVRRSIKLLGSIVLCDGKEVKYEAFDANRAYYIDFDNKYKIVDL